MDNKKISLYVLIVLAVAVIFIFASSVLSFFNNKSDYNFPEVESKNPILGKKNTPVVIVEYGDFQCPYCQELASIFRDVYTEYEGEVSIVWKDFPLYEIHDQSLNAAKAARCAQKQDKFWQMHDLLFQNQKKLADDLYVSLASGLEIDTDKFIECYNNNETLDLVQKDIEEGTNLGVQGTPHFFINNYEVTELIEEEQLKDIIDDLL